MLPSINHKLAHWSVHIHPQESHKSATWHIVHAVSGGEDAHGVLQTEHIKKGGRRRGYNTSSQGAHHQILGSFNNAGDAKAAAESLKGIKCDNHFPDENCVDWTRQAVQHLHANGHISKEKHDQIIAYHDTHQAAVRAKTDTAHNRQEAGHK